MLFVVFKETFFKGFYLFKLFLFVNKVINKTSRIFCMIHLTLYVLSFSYKKE